MKKIFFMLLLAAMTLGASARGHLYKIKVKDGEGKEIALRQYRGQVLLIVNTATQCGFTPQYTELEKLYENYHGQGLEILDFPCNQFGGQAPGDFQQIHQFCTGKYDIQFPQFDKIEVNGPGTHPLFALLKEKQGFKGFGASKTGVSMDNMLRKRDPDYAQKSDIKWNFTKFLVDRKGNIVTRFEPTDDIAKVEEAIKKLIK